jgi:hypothetical protein
MGGVGVDGLGPASMVSNNCSMACSLPSAASMKIAMSFGRSPRLFSDFCTSATTAFTAAFAVAGFGVVGLAGTLVDGIVLLPRVVAMKFVSMYV